MALVDIDVFIGLKPGAWQDKSLEQFSLVVPGCRCIQLFIVISNRKIYVFKTASTSKID